MTTRYAINSEGLRAEITALGSELVSLRDREGRDLLWTGDPAVWSGHAPILFPVIGMLANGVYRYDGRTYVMPKHGFARDSEFTLIVHSDAGLELSLSASDATRLIYPFEFVLRIHFAVSGAELAIVAVIRNDGAIAMPMSFGFHPALRWPLPYGRPRNEHVIIFGHAEPAPIRRIDSSGLMVPTRFPNPVEGCVLTLRDDLFIDDALIFDRLQSRSLSYGGSSGPRLKIAWDNLPDFAVWTKPGAGYICVEPWQGLADPVGFDGDIWNKPGIVAVEPGDEQRFSMTITLKDCKNG